MSYSPEMRKNPLVYVRTFHIQSVVLCFSAEGAENNKCLFIVVKRTFLKCPFYICKAIQSIAQIGKLSYFCNTVYLLQLNNGQLPLPNKTFSLWWWVHSVTEHFGPHCKCLFLLHFIYVPCHLQPLYSAGIMCIIQPVSFYLAMWHNHGSTDMVCFQVASVF